jgi:hypothetical protein
MQIKLFSITLYLNAEYNLLAFHLIVKYVVVVLHKGDLRFIYLRTVMMPNMIYVLTLQLKA